MNRTEARAVTDAWVTAWNAHDVDAVLEHFADYAVFTSPVAARLFGGDGVIRGKTAIRAYWTTALDHVPDLHFTVNELFCGQDVIAISYTNQTGNAACEILRFADGVVVEGNATYADEKDPAATRTD